ncbi:MAG TPA: hypothetical protein VFV36_02780, partial [Candidatus Methylomirabilis sp.]|nr:hypothetical protein [Candidatus Methylomirabilis sp.]
MIPTRALSRVATEGLALIRAMEDVAEAEIFVAANATLVARLNFTSHIPCNGVEEPKSLESAGVGVQAVF